MHPDSNQRQICNNFCKTCWMLCWISRPYGWSVTISLWFSGILHYSATMISILSLCFLLVDKTSHHCQGLIPVTAIWSSQSLLLQTKLTLKSVLNGEGVLVVLAETLLLSWCQLIRLCFFSNIFSYILSILAVLFFIAEWTLSIFLGAGQSWDLVNPGGRHRLTHRWRGETPPDLQRSKEGRAWC